MTKKILCLLTSFVLVFSMPGCGGRQVIDTTFAYDKVQIKMPDGTVVTGEVSSWRDYADGDQLQVTVNGVTYLTHASNVVLIND